MKAVLETREILQAKQALEKAKAEALRLAQMEDELRQRLDKLAREAGDVASAESADALIARQQRLTDAKQALAHVLKARFAAELTLARAHEQALRIEEGHLNRERQRLGEEEVNRFFKVQICRLPDPNATDAQLEDKAKRYREYLYRGREVAKVTTRATEVYIELSVAENRLRELERDGQAELERRLRELEQVGAVVPAAPVLVQAEEPATIQGG